MARRLLPDTGPVLLERAVDVPTTSCCPRDHVLEAVQQPPERVQLQNAGQGRAGGRANPLGPPRPRGPCPGSSGPPAEQWRVSGRDAGWHAGI
jgi:hypothetical protein